MSPVNMIRAVADHVEAAELRLRRRPLDERDVAVIRVQLDVAQMKLAGVLEAHGQGLKGVFDTP